MREPSTDRGHNCTDWTTALLRFHGKETLAVTVCDDTIRIALHGLDYRWRRPRWAVEREEPQVAEAMAAIARPIWSAEPHTVRLLQDETKFRTLPHLRRMSIKKVQQAHVPTPEHDNECYSYGGLDLESGDWLNSPFDKANPDGTILPPR